MLSKEKGSELLTQIGLTKIQAKIYLTLLSLDEANARTLTRETNVPRPEVYRALDDLQKKGFIEKIITSPHKFKATPIDYALQILMIKHTQRYKTMQETIKKFLRENQGCLLEKAQKQEYKLIMVEGRERLLQLIRLEHENAQKSVEIVSTLKRWLYILDSCYESYMKALAKNVKYRVIIEKRRGRIGFPEKVKALLAKPSLELRLIYPLTTNAAIFDQKKVTIDFCPNKPLSESPIIWTNHPSFMEICRDHFEKIWNQAQEYKLNE